MLIYKFFYVIIRLVKEFFMTTVYLIRHSVKYSNDDIDIYRGFKNNHIKDLKIILSVEGEKRAEILADEKELQNIDAVYSSDCARTMATAKYMCFKHNLKLNIDKGFNERKVGTPNCDIYNDWFERQYLDKKFKTKGGESQEEVSKRFHRALNKVLKENESKRIAIFTHGYAITFSLLKWCKLESINEDRELKLSFNDKVFFNKKLNAPEVFKLIFDKDKLYSIELIEFNDLPYFKSIK